MGLRTKINLLLTAIWILGVALFLIFSSPFLAQLGNDEVAQISRIMMEDASGARKYTSIEIAPLLKRDLRTAFHPQAVSSYAAKKSFEVLHQEYPDYTYREVALNPTNLEDRPADWEADIVNDFRAHQDKHEIVVQRTSALGRSLNLARPVVAATACLECHNTPQAAPKSMTDIYGRQNGFGWKPNEIIGAQIVSVPMTIAATRADQIRAVFIVPFSIVFLILFIMINVVLNLLVLGPVDDMTRTAERISMGEIDAPEYVRNGSDQIARLSNAINRMRRSLSEALRMLDS